MAAFCGVVDLIGLRRWAFPFAVIGMNSIAAYCMAELLEEFVTRSLHTHLGREPFRALGPGYEPLLTGGAVLLVFWLVLFWMYRRRIFLRV